jgi:CubicO group peptidase (beta-lactamase class C family)
MSPRKASAFYPLPTAEPEEVGFSSERLARIGPALEKYIDRRMVPFLVTLVARHGKVVHYEAQGYLDLDTKNPAGKDAIARIWSNSKCVAGLATMICVEDGLLTLDDPISQYIPAFKDPVVLAASVPPEAPRPAMGAAMPTVPAVREITVRDCLRNTTGLMTAQSAPVQVMTMYRDIVAKLGWLNPIGGSGGGSVRDSVETLAKLPLAAQPGTQFVYQVGYPALGLVLEAVTGKPLEDFYQERIIKPLGMKDTSFYLLPGRMPQFSTCYRPSRAGGAWKLAVQDKATDSEKAKGPKTYFEPGGGGGGLLSTVGDYARFAQCLLNGGELDGVRIMGRKSVEMMTSSHTAQGVNPPMSGADFGFGIGVGVYKGGGLPRLRSVGTYGWGGAAGTSYFCDPKEDLIAIIFTQVLMHMMMPGNLYQEDFERLVYQALI